MLIVGSEALSHYAKLDRAPNDVDIVVEYDELQRRLDNMKQDGYQVLSQYPINEKYIVCKMAKNDVTWMIEAEIAWSYTTAALLLDIVDEYYAGTLHAPPDVLYTLKMSHRYLKNSPAFLKTMKDIHLLRDMGASIPEHLQGFYQKRMKETYNYKHPNLDVGKGEFFNGDGINYIYDHDSLHEAVKLGDKPAYSYFKPHDKEVKVSKEMFFDLPLDIQLMSVAEESYVLALERSQIPHPGVLSPYESFLKALEKVCTSITSGWWREFAWENYYTVVAMYNEDYVDKFRHALNNGIVKPFSG